jgi:ABC-type nitrate/sulfonate/bicarbonate transport system ATPase subunit
MKACAVEVLGISKRFRVDGRVVHALDDVSLCARAGEFVSLVGPSGCGKSTLLNLICGLLEPDSGVITLGDEQGPRLGRVGLMPQQDLLMPWRRLLDNVLLGPEIQRRDLSAARAEARQLLPLFGLEGFERSYPAQLSGGMRQRAALLRTMLCHPAVLALDEPFGALDALTRRGMRDWLLQVWSRFGQTVLFVTHDVDEAIYLSDRVLVMSPRPGAIVLDVDIPLPRPRQAHHLELSVAADIRRALLNALGL